MTDDIQVSTLIPEIIKHVFGAEREQLRKQELELINENNKALAVFRNGFRFNGHLFTQLEGKYIRDGEYSHIHPVMRDRAQAYLDETKQLNFDVERTTQALAVLLRDCKTHQDIRDALPDSLKDCLPGITDLPRTRDEAFTLHNNPRLSRQYKKARERIDFYIATKNLGSLYRYIAGQ